MKLKEKIIQKPNRSTTNISEGEPRRNNYCHQFANLSGKWEGQIIKRNDNYQSRRGVRQFDMVNKQ